MKKETRYIKEYILGRKITINLNIQELILLDNKIINKDTKKELEVLKDKIDNSLNNTLKDMSKEKEKEITNKVIAENNKY